jgi:hypothetical protein
LLEKEATGERHVREHADHSWLRLNNTPEHWEIVVTWMDGTGYGYACRHWDKERGEWGSYMTEVESRQELARVSEDIGKIDNSMLASSDYSIIVVRPTETDPTLSNNRWTAALDLGSHTINIRGSLPTKEEALAAGEAARRARQSSNSVKLSSSWRSFFPMIPEL